MATNANWTVVFDDKLIINQNLKNEEGFGTAYTIAVSYTHLTLPTILLV